MGSDKVKIVKVNEGEFKKRDYPVSILLIPFRFNRRKIDETKEILLNRTWKQEDQLSNNEFFQHIRLLLDESQQSAICSKLVRNNGDLVIRSKANNKNIAKINNIELYLFKTGVGFYRFSVTYLEDLDIEGVIARNNELKSIAHNLDEIVINTEVAIEYLDEHVSDSDSNYITAIDYTNKKTSINLSKKDLVGIDIEQEVKITYGENKKKFIRYSRLAKLDIRDFINNELQDIPDLDYFNQYTYDQGKKQMVSKANVFVSCLLDSKVESELDVSDMTFMLSRGYKGSYKKKMDVENSSFFSTFDNSFWSVSREGIANLAWLVEDETTNTFFMGTYLDRLENYFFLYIIALHQYYGLIKVAQDISMLPSSIEDYSDDSCNYNRLKSIYNEINFIYLKCIYHEVTHISHQAQVYEKIFNMLGIESLLTEINFEMDRLTNIVDQIRDNKRIEMYQKQEIEYRERMAQQELSEQNREEEFREQQKQWKIENDENARNEATRLHEVERKKDREKKYAIIGSIFAFFTVFEALWNVAILSNITEVLNIPISDRLMYFCFVLAIIIISTIVGMIAYFIWNRSKH